MAPRSGTVLLLVWLHAADLQAVPIVTSDPIAGVNLPWRAYGHDFGNNGWGHDGFSTSGATYQTYFDSQGFGRTRLSREAGCAAPGALAIEARLDGLDPYRRGGEEYISLETHGPLGAAPINLSGATVRMCLKLPAGAAGEPSRPNGVQFVMWSDGWNHSALGWRNITAADEGHWVSIEEVLPSSPVGGFDPGKVIAVGFKIGIGGSSAAAFSGTVLLDDYLVERSGERLLAFDFRQLEIESDLDVVLADVGPCARRWLRVFVFADGAASPDFVDGQVTGLDADFYDDFDVLFEAAYRRGISLVPVLLDFRALDHATVVSGVPRGGHSNLFRVPERRQEFLERAVRPFVQRYGAHPALAAIEVINEPEWRVADINPGGGGDPVTQAEMRAFIAAVVQEIASSTPAGTSHKPVTVGSAKREWVAHWTGLGLDLYQFHWYDYMGGFPWPPASDFDKLALTGEVPTAGTAHSVAEYFDAARDGGYLALLFWSYAGRDAASDPSVLGAIASQCAVPSGFHTLGPCRLVDTRGPAGPSGGPALAAGTDRFLVLAGRCGVPTGARALALNVTVTEPTAAGDLRLYRADLPLPFTSNHNYSAGQTRANNAIVSLDAAGQLAVRCDQQSGTTHVILDVYGYFQ